MHAARGGGLGLAGPDYIRERGAGRLRLAPAPGEGARGAGPGAPRPEGLQPVRRPGQWGHIRWLGRRRGCESKERRGSPRGAGGGRGGWFGLPPGDRGQPWNSSEDSPSWDAPDTALGRRCPGGRSMASASS